MPEFKRRLSENGVSRQGSAGVIQMWKAPLSLMVLPCACPSLEAEPARGRRKRMRTRRKRRKGRGAKPLLWLVSEWPEPHSGHQRLGFYTQVPRCPWPPLISSRQQGFSKAVAHQGLVLLPFAHAFDQRMLGTKGTARKLFLRAAWDFLGWLQRSESNLQLLCGRPQGSGR